LGPFSYKTQDNKISVTESMMASGQNEEWSVARYDPQRNGSRNNKIKPTLRSSALNKKEHEGCSKINSKFYLFTLYSVIMFDITILILGVVIENFLKHIQHLLKTGGSWDWLLPGIITLRGIIYFLNRRKRNRLRRRRF